MHAPAGTCTHTHTHTHTHTLTEEFLKQSLAACQQYNSDIPREDIDEVNYKASGGLASPNGGKAK